MKNCEECGVAYDEKVYFQKYCSRACSKRREKRDWKKRRREKKLQEKFELTGLKKREKYCKECGSKFELSSSGVKYCSDQCRQIGGEKVRLALAEAAKLKRLQRTRECKTCGVTFKPNGTQRYCSEECKGIGVSRSVRCGWLRSQYNITLEQYEEMCESAGNRCQICNTECKLVVDHCHSSGKVRDLLCSNCNTGIGLFGEDPMTMKNAIKYLNKHNGLFS